MAFKYADMLLKLKALGSSSYVEQNQMLAPSLCAYRPRVTRISTIIKAEPAIRLGFFWQISLPIRQGIDVLSAVILWFCYFYAAFTINSALKVFFYQKMVESQPTIGNFITMKYQ